MQNKSNESNNIEITFWPQRILLTRLRLRVVGLVSIWTQTGRAAVYATYRSILVRPIDMSMTPAIATAVLRGDAYSPYFRLISCRSPQKRKDSHLLTATAHPAARNGFVPRKPRPVYNGAQKTALCVITGQPRLGNWLCSAKSQPAPAQHSDKNPVFASSPDNLAPENWLCSAKSQPVPAQQSDKNPVFASSPDNIAPGNWLCSAKSQPALRNRATKTRCLRHRRTTSRPEIGSVPQNRSSPPGTSAKKPGVASQPGPRKPQKLALFRKTATRPATDTQNPGVCVTKTRRSRLDHDAFFEKTPMKAARVHGNRIPECYSTTER